MIDLSLAGKAFQLFGDGSVSRSFTYIDDVVEANLAALLSESPSGSVCNIANESTASMTELIDLVSNALGQPVRLDRLPAAAGDAQRTGGSSALAAELLGWSPSTSLESGVKQMVSWCREEAELAQR
jgi:nucleoside-diphosphate-sugar epimerase